MQKENEGKVHELDELFKQRVFASAFGALDYSDALKRYQKYFVETKAEPTFNPEEFEEWVPQSPGEVEEMLAAAFRAGAIS